MGMHSAAVFSVTLALLLLLSDLNAVNSKPMSLMKRHAAAARRTSGHVRQKRATFEDIFGDLTAQASGILNEDRLPYGNCKEIFDSGQKTSGLYRINPGGDAGEFTVFCDMTLRGGGWTVMLRRINDSAEPSFDRKWGDYRNGFGIFNANFWLGLQKIKDITDYKSATYELYVGLESYHPTITLAFSLFNSFSLGDEASKYSLSIGTLDGTSTAGNALMDHDGQKFSTSDDDNDDNGMENCALNLCAGWWYTNCLDSHLTGKYYSTGILPDLNTPDGIIWEQWRGTDEPLQTAVMAVRPA